MGNYIPFDIQTEAGKRLWRTMNRYHGSVVWGPVGDGIVEIEAEMRNTGATRDYYAGMTEGRIQERERIIKLLETLRSEYRAMTSPDDSDVVNVCITLIKGEQ